MKIAVINENDAAFPPAAEYMRERRCSASPNSIKRLVGAKAEVLVQSGAGELAGYTDKDYLDAGAEIVTDRSKALSLADIVLYVNKPTDADMDSFKAGAVIIGHLDPFFQQPLVEKLRAKNVTAISVELVPRSTRCQKMDALSSQTSLAGYAMVINAAREYDSILPMMMTPSGTIKPAKVFVIGAGVAGLQAIATAKRLGASVLAFDTRPVVAEQVQSLGGKFLHIDLGDTGETNQGYANELTPEQMKLQKEGQLKAIADSDIVITTAQLFGRKPPRLISKDDLAAMRPGSVVVDMAAESGGNVEGSVAGEITVINGVKVIGTGNWPNQLPNDATEMYANNLFNLLDDFWDAETGNFVVNMEDEVMQSCVVVHEGKLLNEALQKHYAK